MDENNIRSSRALHNHETQPVREKKTPDLPETHRVPEVHNETTNIAVKHNQASEYRSRARQQMRLADLAQKSDQIKEQIDHSKAFATAMQKLGASDDDQERKQAKAQVVESLRALQHAVGHGATVKASKGREQRPDEERSTVEPMRLASTTTVDKGTQPSQRPASSQIGDPKSHRAIGANHARHVPLHKMVRLETTDPAEAGTSSERARDARPQPKVLHNPVSAEIHDEEPTVASVLKQAETLLTDDPVSISDEDPVLPEEAPVAMDHADAIAMDVADPEASEQAGHTNRVIEQDHRKLASVKEDVEQTIAFLATTTVRVLSTTDHEERESLEQSIDHTVKVLHNQEQTVTSVQGKYRPESSEAPAKSAASRDDTGLDMKDVEEAVEVTIEDPQQMLTAQILPAPETVRQLLF